MTPVRKALDPEGSELVAFLLIGTAIVFKPLLLLVVVRMDDDVAGSATNSLNGLLAV